MVPRPMGKLMEQGCIVSILAITASLSELWLILGLFDCFPSKHSHDRSFSAANQLKQVVIYLLIVPHPYCHDRG